MGRRNFPEAWDGLGNPWGGSEQTGGSSEKSGTGWGTLGEARDGSGDPPGGPR